MLDQDIFNILEENDIQIQDCRGQSQYNTENMSGKYNGVQAILREKCSVAHYVPSTAHSPNLVGKSAAEGGPAATRFKKKKFTYFFILQNLYTWLVASTHRWQGLHKQSKRLPVNKALSDTR